MHLRKRVERLEQEPTEEVVEIAGLFMTARALAALLREIDGKSRGLPSDAQHEEK